MITPSKLESFEQALPRRRQRIPLADLWQALGATFPAEVETGRARATLATVLQSLTERGYRLPKGRSSYDRSSVPELPPWIERARTAAPATAEDAAEVFWCQELIFLYEQKHLAGKDRWRQLDSWLKMNRGQQLTPIPSRERSFEIFGDEKALDALGRSAYFERGDITLAALRCFTTNEPLTIHTGPAGSHGLPLLVVENSATYVSLRRWNAKAGRYCGVAYGGGKRFEGAWQDVALEREDLGFSEVRYFGDIDVTGLEIPLRSAAALDQKLGLPLHLEEWLYRLLFTLTPPQRWRTAEGKTDYSTELLDWLPAGLRQDCSQVLVARQRIPQEGLRGTDLPVISNATLSSI